VVRVKLYCNQRKAKRDLGHGALQHIVENFSVSKQCRVGAIVEGV